MLCGPFVQFLLLNTVDELLIHIDRDQLTADLGGTFPFSVHEWIQHRAVRNWLVYWLNVAANYSTTLWQWNNVMMSMSVCGFVCVSVHEHISRTVSVICTNWTYIYEIRDAILTCNQKLTWVSLIYCTEPTSKKWKNRKTKKLKNGYAQRYL